MNIVQSIYETPEKWKQTEFTFLHENGAEIWTRNVPILSTNMYPSIHMSLITKFKIWRAIRWWSKNAPIEAFGRK